MNQPAYSGRVPTSLSQLSAITEAGSDGTTELDYGEDSQTLAGGEIILMGGSTPSRLLLLILLI